MEGQILWDSNILPERKVEEFLHQAVKRGRQEIFASQLQDEETMQGGVVRAQKISSHTEAPRGSSPGGRVLRLLVGDPRWVP